MMTWEQKKQQGISYLNKYKDEISQEGYDSILYVIGTQALADHFVTEDSIKNMIQLEKNEVTSDELIDEIILKNHSKWSISF